MPEFQPAFEACMKHEGGYVWDRQDHGGETYMGISRNNWRGWNGWEQIDRRKKEKDFPACLASNSDLQARVREFYRRNFWLPLMEQMPSQDLANWLFDKAVNTGYRRACKLLQAALCVDQDGVIGPQTKAMLAAADPEELLARCRGEAKKYYTKLALSDPTQTKFLHGWLARA